MVASSLHRLGLVYSLCLQEREYDKHKRERGEGVGEREEEGYVLSNNGYWILQSVR